MELRHHFSIAAAIGLILFLFKFLKRRPKFNLNGKIVLITGASSGLGEGLSNARHSFLNW